MKELNQTTPLLMHMNIYFVFNSSIILAAFYVLYDKSVKNGNLWERFSANFQPAMCADFQWLLLEVSSELSMNGLLKYIRIFVS